MREPMQGQGPYFIPQGAPPGTPLLMEEERPPEAVYYFRIYAVVMILILLAGFGVGLYLMLKPLMSGTAGTTSATGDWIFGLFMAGMTFALLIPHAVALFAGRAKWNYTLIMILVGLNILWSNCWCIPVTVPLLIYWMKPETKRWFGVT